MPSLTGSIVVLSAVFPFSLQCAPCCRASQSPRAYKRRHDPSPGPPFDFSSLYASSPPPLPTELSYSMYVPFSHVLSLIVDFCGLSDAVAIISSMAYIPPPYPSSRRCACGSDVPLRFVHSANLRNSGRPYYACNICRSWYRWGDGLGNSPRNSPVTSPTTDQGGNFPPPLPAPAVSLPATAQAENADRCNHRGCMVTRVGRNCQRHMCRKHCCAAGGCTALNHSGTGSNPTSSGTSTAICPPPSHSSSIYLAPSSSSSSSSSLSNVDLAPRPAICLPVPPSSISYSSSSFTPSSSSSSSLASLPELPSQPPRTTVVDASINPRYASQLRPIFVDQVAEVHERAEQKRRRAQEDQEDKKRVRERVVAFSFTEDDESPVVVSFQDGFSYPHFKLTQAVLDELELASPDGNNERLAVHYFDLHFKTWVKMKVNSVIELTKPSQVLFFKGTNVKSYPSFDHHLAATATPTSHQTTNPRVSLSQERRYVRQVQATTRTRGGLHALPVLEISSDEDSGRDNLPLLSLQKRQRRQPSARIEDSDEDIISLDDDEDNLMPILSQEVAAVPLIPGVTVAKFPSTYYAVDLHRMFGFTPTRNMTSETRFKLLFQLPWKSSTYYDNKTRWLAISQNLRDIAVAAGRTKAGEYPALLARHRASKSAEDANSESSQS